MFLKQYILYMQFGRKTLSQTIFAEMQLQYFLMVPSKSTREGLLMNPLCAISITIRFIITGYKALSRYNEHKYKIILHFFAVRKKAIARCRTVLNSQLSCLAHVWRVYDERFGSTKDSRVFPHFKPRIEYSYKRLWKIVKNFNKFKFRCYKHAKIISTFARNNL